MVSYPARWRPLSTGSRVQIIMLWSVTPLVDIHFVQVIVFRSHDLVCYTARTCPSSPETSRSLWSCRSHVVVSCTAHRCPASLETSRSLWSCRSHVVVSCTAHRCPASPETSRWSWSHRMLRSVVQCIVTYSQNIQEVVLSCFKQSLFEFV